MANVQKGNVLIIDTDNYSDSRPLTIAGIKWKAKGSNPTAAIRADASASGQVLWESNIAADAENYEEIEIFARGGIHVDIAGTGSILYIYLK